MAFEWHDIFGFVGVLLVIGIYLLSQLGRTSPADLSFSVINGLGAAMILISLNVDFNLSAFLIEAAWLSISLIGIVLHFFRNKPQTKTHRQESIT